MIRPIVLFVLVFLDLPFKITAVFESNRVRRLWPWLAVLLLAALAAQPLWGLPPQGDDLLLHYFRIPLVNGQWAAGVPLARWQPDLIYGYGSPLFNFYPPLSAWLLTALYWLTGQQADVAINLLFALCLLLGAVGMFGLGRVLAGEVGGLVATAVFTFSPHVANQIYSRASTSNSLALGLVPLVAWLLWRLAERPSSRRMVFAAVGIALLLLSHAAASLLLLGPLLAWSLVVMVGQSRARRHWLALLGAFGLGLSIAAFAWLPAFTEIQFTRYAAEAANVWYGNHFTSLWAWPGTAVAGLRGAYLPKTVGLVALLLGAGGTAVSGWSLLRWRRSRDGEFPAQDAAFFAAGLLGWAVLFLTLPASDLIWRLIAPLRGLQFPWRLLDVPAFFLVVAGLRLFSNRYSVIGERWPVSGIVLVGVVVVCYVNLVPYLYPPRWVALPEQPTLADVTAVQQQYQIIGLTAWGEYSDARVATWPTGPVVPAGSALADKLLTAAPSTSLILQESDPWTAVWQTNFAQPTTLTFASHIFPGWQAKLDDDDLAVDADENGRLQLTVPAGEHRLKLWFGRTPLRWLADLLSVAGLLVCLWLVLFKRDWRLEIGDGKALQISNLQSPILPSSLIVMLALLLLLGKIFWLDQANSPLVVHVADGRIPNIPAPAAGNFNDEIQLIGVERVLPNELTLYWQALQSPTAAYEVALTLLDGRGVPQQTIVNPSPGYTVFSNLSTGQILRDEYTLPLPSDAPAAYTVQLALHQPGSDSLLPLLDADGNTTINIAQLKTPPEETAVPAEAIPIGTQFGEGIVLSYASLPQTVSMEEPLELTLFWQAVGPIPEDYTVFLHLLTPEGDFVQGQDGQPLDGLYPTSFWGEGEMVVDGRFWFADVPAGEYQLQVGLYLLATGQRLPTSGPRGELGDRVIVGTIQLIER
ncbi:6-pyruvoyl-tetrahydropterin synthase-related protein [Candidatus Leptofilum sp.]|uniref:6-pyruvoyl-tetrahydropterin synthase-related protein n=1 Tax=Candidatus Leptofilum sp. TaxID=3241576 RepID=UPI003B5B8152